MFAFEWTSIASACTIDVCIACYRISKHLAMLGCRNKDVKYAIQAKHYKIYSWRKFYTLKRLAGWIILRDTPWTISVSDSVVKCNFNIYLSAYRNYF